MKDRGGDPLDHDPDIIGRSAADDNENLAAAGGGHRAETVPPARPLRASSARPWVALWLAALAATIALALSGRPFAGSTKAPSATPATQTASDSSPRVLPPGWVGEAGSPDPWFGDLQLRVVGVRAVRASDARLSELTLTAEIEAAREHGGELRWLLAGLVARPYAVGGSTVPLVAAPPSARPRAARPTLRHGANRFALRADPRQLRWLVTGGRTLWLVLQIDDGERSALLAVPVELTPPR